MALTSISLFTGAMGLDLGLEGAGFKTKVALEMDRDAVATIRRNRPSLPVINKDISYVSSSEILRLGGLTRGNVDLVCGGPCCQSFSTAGTRSSLSDERKGRLFYEFTRIVEDVRPRFFVIENVRGILSAAVRHRPLRKRGPGFPPLEEEEQFGSALKAIREELSLLGYRVKFGLFNSADFGVPQVRHRVIFIGSRDGEEIEFPNPTHSKDAADGLPPWVTLREAISKVPDPNPEYLPFGTRTLPLLKMLKAGENWRDLPKRVHKLALGGAFDSWGGRSGFCRRLSWDRPAPTLTTSPTGNATCLCHPVEDRPLSVGEYSMIQQFPSDWVFTGSISQRYRQIGNAVPVGLACAIGASLRTVARRIPCNAVDQPKINRSKSQGQVVSDIKLETWLSKRPECQLNPPSMRRYKSMEAAKAWLAKCL